MMMKSIYWKSCKQDLELLNILIIISCLEIKKENRITLLSKFAPILNTKKGLILIEPYYLNYRRIHYRLLDGNLLWTLAN